MPTKSKSPFPPMTIHSARPNCEFADGSTLRNDFTNAVLNPRLDPSLFAPKLNPDYKIVEPLK